MAFFQNLFKSKNAGSSESVLERVRRGEESNNLRGADDELVWFRDLEKHAFGKYSYAAVRVSDVAHKEEFSEVVPGPKAVFIGLYDGHNGAEASRFVSENLYPALLRRVKQRGSISGDDVQVAFDEVERGFMEEVDKVAPHPSMRTQLTIAGTSCLVAIVWKRQLLLATLGDSRAVLGTRQTGLQVRGRQLTTSAHILKENLRKGDRYYCLKGMTNMTTTHSLGDLYLKESRFNRNHNDNDPFNVGKRISYPLIQSAPEIVSEKIDGLVNRFVIIASKGFWQEFNTEEATKLVAANPKKGIARRLLVCAMERAAEGKMMRYDAIKGIPAGEERSAIHEDMTVIVLFLDFIKFYKKPREDLFPTHAFQGRVANFNF